MKNILGLIILIALVSCQKNVKNKVSNLPKKDFKVNFSKSDLVDTIFFSDDEKTKFQDFAIANLLEKKYEKDSFCIASFRLDFIKNNKPIYSQKIQIKGYDEGSDWNGKTEYDSINISLKNISVGYSACGYAWNHFLFDIAENKSSLVFESYSNSDSGQGIRTEIIPFNSQQFYSRTISYYPTDEDENIIHREYSDSIKFEKVNDKWIKTQITPKELVYRKEEKAFNNSEN